MTTGTSEMLRLVKLGRRAEARKKAAALIAAFIDGFYLMLAVGIVHHDWIRALPTVGYWTAVLVVVVLRGVFSKLPDTSKTEG